MFSKHDNIKVKHQTWYIIYKNNNIQILIYFKYFI